MARYIDADKLIAHLKDEIDACEPIFDGRANGKSVAYGTELGLKAAISFAETLSVADVVPKSEVEKIQEAYNNRLAKDIQTNADFVKYAKAEVAREIFEEIESKKLFVRDRIGNMRAVVLFEDIAKLKKKYTEGKE